MNDLACLMRAILADPEDDTVRLAYADLLQEHGKDNRAEYIRLEVAADALPESDPQKQTLQSQADALLASPGVTQAPWSWGYGISHYWFRRGFVEGVRLTPTAFSRHWRRLSGIVPLRDAHFFSKRSAPLPRDWLRPALSVSGFTTVRSLNLSFTGITDHHVRQLLDARTLGRVSYLGLSSCSYLTRGAIRALAHSPRLTELRSLDLAACGPDVVGSRGATVIARSTTFANLTQLDLSYCAIRDRGARALADSPFLGGLTDLRFSGNFIGRRTAEALRDRFGQNLRMKWPW